MENKPNIQNIGYKMAIENLKKKIKATSHKIRHFENRINQFRQNQLFQHNHKFFYQQLNLKEIKQKPPKIELYKKFWKYILKNKTEQQKSLLIDNVKNQLDRKKPEKDMEIIIQDLRETLQSTAN